jgi:cell shape-determining protein MreC
MARRPAQTTRRALLTWFMLAGVILLLIPNTMTSRLQFAVLNLLRRPIQSGRMIGLWAQTTASTGGSVPQKEYQKAVDENLLLRHSIANMEALLQQEQQKVTQLTRWRQLIPWERTGFIAADVVSTTAHQLFINRGSSDGLAKGQFVLSDEAIIGTISELETRMAKVELVTSPASRLPVSLRPSNVQGVLRGIGDGLMKIQVKPPCAAGVGEKVYVQKTAELESPLVVGDVVQGGVDDQDPVLWAIKVQPSFNLNRVGTVLVIVPASP